MKESTLKYYEQSYRIEGLFLKKGLLEIVLPHAQPCNPQAHAHNDSSDTVRLMIEISHGALHMSGYQNHDPLLGPLNTRCPAI